MSLSVPPLVPARPSIAIAGATGRVGSALTEALVAQQVPVLALTRNPEGARLPAGAAVAAIDFDAPDSLARALAGIDRLFIGHGTSPRQAENEIALIDAATNAGVRHIVKLSVLGPPLHSHPFDWHARIEAHLAAQSVGYTLLRPSPFNDILRRMGAQIANDTWAGAAGTGRANFIDTRDVADVARIALLDDAAMHSKRAYHLTGPRAWTMQQIAAELSRLLGRTVTYTSRTPAQHRAALLDAGTSEFVVDLLLGLDETFRESTLAEVTSTVEELTGHPPRSLTQWLAENVSLFRR